jgi:hypothetical protein
MGIEVFQYLITSVADEGLLPIDAGLGEAPDVDVVRQHSLTDVLEVDEVVLSGDLVGIVHEKSCVAVGLGAQWIPIVVVWELVIGSSFGGSEESRLSKPSRDVVKGCRCLSKSMRCEGTDTHK